MSWTNRHLAGDYSDSLPRFFSPAGQFNDLASLFTVNYATSMKYLLHFTGDDSSTPFLLCMFFVVFCMFACWTYGYCSAIKFVCAQLARWRSLWSHLCDVRSLPRLPVGAQDGMFALIGAASMLGGMARMTISLAVIILGLILPRSQDTAGGGQRPNLSAKRRSTRFSNIINRHHLAVLPEPFVRIPAGDTTLLYNDQCALSYRDMKGSYPRYPSVSDIQLDEEERDLCMDLTSYMNTTPYTVQEQTPVPRVFYLTLAHLKFFLEALSEAEKQRIQGYFHRNRCGSERFEDVEEKLIRINDNWQTRGEREQWQQLGICCCWKFSSVET
ncbi:unnamed protein product [Peronospora belbahrii]|uniref:Uncharacterized protein n=1 Tax=Peronospora belbahrii TaxID=622444 RepID=A0AAU9KPB5_9STRA|nr:unnamed protein product [Peronospora belbahrii]CAH0521580.1 unnamed protein product [Peronospora belbahrii]